MRAISEEFGVAVDRRTAWKYDASRLGCTIGPKYKKLFQEVRDRWLNDLAAIPIAQQGHRLRLLDRLAGKLERAGDYLGAAKAVEQAAKEVGGIFTNERKSMVEARVMRVPIDAEAARAELAARLAIFLDKMPASVNRSNERLLLPDGVLAGPGNRHGELAPDRANAP